LLAHRVDPNTRNRWEWTPLHDAAIRGHAEIVKMLLDAGTDPSAHNSAGEGGYTALHYTSTRRERECVRLLLAHGADIDAKTSASWTSLMEACHHGHGEVVGILLRARANVEMEDVEGRTALQMAVAAGNVECARLLRE
ncbi:ankyrin, partial [Bimuria novae-zelandiae CBS 107.79]